MLQINEQALNADLSGIKWEPTVYLAIAIAAKDKSLLSLYGQ